MPNRHQQRPNEPNALRRILQKTAALRVLHLYAGNLYGGIEKVLTTLASQRHLCPEMEPTFALCFEGRLANELRATGAEVHMLGQVRLSRPWTTWRARRSLLQLLKQFPHFDVAMTHSCWLHAAFAPTVRSAGIPLYFWAHDSYLNLNRIDHIAARTKPDRVIANSRFTLGTVPALFPGVPGEVVYYPIAPPPPMDRPLVKQQVRRTLGCAEASTVIFMGARLEKWKGHTLLLEGLSTLPAGHWEAWIAGGPQRPHEQDYYSELQSMAKRFGIDKKIRWLGPRKDIPQLLAAADIHCQPNTGPEPFGIVFVEALQAGLPVVTTRLGASPEIVDETSGILTPPGDSKSLARALETMIDPASQKSLAGGPERAKSLCELAVQLHRLREALIRTT
jgi:glycosyltransferase involved in cell wall biosynthesis